MEHDWDEFDRTQFAVPVKYMVIKHWFGFEIIDTSFEGQGNVVCKVSELVVAHHICKLLNNHEGYEYAPAIG